MGVGHDAHEIRILGKRPAAADAEVSDARRHHRKITGEIDHVHHSERRRLLEPETDPARLGLEFSGTDVVHLSRDVTARRDHHGRIVGSDCRPDSGHKPSHERGPRLPVFANGRHPKPDAVRILKASRPVIGMAEAVAAAMLPHGLLGRLPRQVADQSVVHRLAVTGQELDRADPQILVAIERKHDVAVDIVAVRSQLGELRLFEDDVGWAEILLEERIVGQRLELWSIGGVALRLAGRHPRPQHGDFGGSRRLRPHEIKVTLDLRRRHPSGGDLLEAEFDPLDGVVVAEKAERAGLAGTVALLALSVQEGEDVPEERRRVLRQGRGTRRRSLRAIDRAARSLGPRFADLAAGEKILDRFGEFRLGIAGRHHAADLVAVVDPTRVADPAITVDEHHLGRDRHIERRGEREVGVVVDRERDAVIPAVHLDCGGVVAFADDAHEADALATEIGSQRTEHGSIFLSERAGGMEKREADGPAGGTEEIGERNGAAIVHPHRETVRRQGRLGRHSRAGDKARQEPHQSTCPQHSSQHNQSHCDHVVVAPPIISSLCRRESFSIVASRLHALWQALEPLQPPVGR